jgi:hypothetical protein
MTTPPASPSAGPPPADQPEDKPNRMPWVVAGLLLLAVGVGVACFFIGKSSADTSQKETEAAAKVQLKYTPGHSGYEEIYNKGKEAGLKEGKAQGQAQGQQKGKEIGLQQGTKAGQAQGNAEGVKSGANAALGGFSSWDTNGLYIVNVDPGADVPYAISSRQQMQENVGYRLCADDPSNLCQIPIPNDGG